MDLEADRKQCTDRILASSARHRLVVAGAGTGKTHAFKKILEALGGGSALALTFINNLARDMSRELADLAEARTFHSYCKKLLHRTSSDGISTSFHFFPMLGKLIGSDARLLRKQAELPDLKFDYAFLTLSEDDGRIAFYLERASYYDAVGFEDGVYRVLRSFRENAETIPTFQCVLVDEYQDFCALEVAFIDQLRIKSPTVIVGDDDQALYAFRGASPAFLRAKASSGEFETFDLPYCSRCPKVIVEATNAVLKRAVQQGLLSGRLEKRYDCYLPDKQADSDQHPHIYRVHCSVESKRTAYISAYIRTVIRGIAEGDRQEARDKGYPLILIIGPAHYLRKLEPELRDDVGTIELRVSDGHELDHLDAYRILLRDPKANLGWRILIELEQPTRRRATLLRTAVDENRALLDLVDPGWAEGHLSFLKIIRKAIESAESLSQAERQEIQVRLSLSPEDVADKLGQEKLEATDEPDSTQVPEALLCTFPGAKGLSGGYVFVVGLTEGNLPRRNDHATDTELCQFVVALTRTRKECHLISVGRFAGQAQRRSVFLNWIPAQHIEDRSVTKDAIVRS